MRHFTFLFTLLILLLPSCEQRPSEPRRSSDRPTTPVRVKLTPGQLRGTPDDRLESLIADAMFAAMRDKYEWEYEVVEAWPPGLRMLYTTWQVEGEVNNGGFNQYFWNTDGQLADMALEGFRLVRAAKYADIMQRAIATHKREVSEMQKYKENGTLDAFSESYEHTDLNKLDEEFFDLDEDLSGLRIKYIRAHLDEFVQD
jgi:hypothetical protein